MAVRFVLGRAGSGKTHHCLAAIRQRLRTDPVDGPKLIFLVPEQASQQMERAVLLSGDASDPPIAAAHRAEVLSFQRLAHRILETATAPSRTLLSDSGRIMVLRHLASEHAQRLRYYRRLSGCPGLFDRFAAAVTELIQEGVAPGDLPLKSDEGGALSDPAHAAKCHDIALLYEKYLEYLGSQRLDPSQRLQLARRLLPRCRWPDGAEIWMDGFASLSGEESATLVSLAQRAAHLDIALLLDPCLPDPSERSRPGQIFSRVLRTYGELVQKLQETAVPLREPLLLGGRPLPRFARTPRLSQLERRLFHPHTDATESLPVSVGLSLAELPNRRIEVEYAVSKICEWTRCRPPRFRYRDIAVIVRDLDPYHDLLRSALQDRSIPCFIDRRRSLGHHPLIELLRTAAQAADDDLSLESARLLLKTGLMPLAAEQVDELENYCLAHGISGWKLWSETDWAFEKPGGGRGKKTSSWHSELLTRVNASRRIMVDALTPWMTFAATAGGHTAAQWAQGIQDWLGRIHGSDTLATWARRAEQLGDLDQAAEHRQTWAELGKLLTSIADALGDQRLDRREFSEILESALGGLTLGLVPPTVDQVLVASIERSRHPDIKAAIVIGFNDGVFPARLAEDPIFNDDDRLALTARGVRIGPPASHRLEDELMLVYIALTRASEQVVVTYAHSDELGQALRPSPFIRELQRACPGLAAEAVEDPVACRAPWDVQSRGDLRRRLVHEFRTRPARDRDNVVLRTHWNGLYDASRSELRADPGARFVFESLRDPPKASLSQATVSRLYSKGLTASITGLEAYASCPFKYFSERVLGLKERAESALAEVDVGIIHHAILEDYIRALAGAGVGFARLSPEALMEGLKASCVRVSGILSLDDAPSDPRNRYLLRRSASRLARILHAQRNATPVESLRPHAAELAFGIDAEGGLPAFELTTPAGRTVLLRGYIDRVDLVESGDEVLGVIVDYKETHNKKLDFCDVYHGLSLQLPAYLLVLAEQGHALAGRSIRPAGALFVSLASRYHLVDHPERDQHREQHLQGTYKIRGLLHEDSLQALGIEVPPSASAKYHSVRRDKDGALSHPDGNDAVAPSTYDALLAHTRSKLGELADGILSGDVAVWPYRLGTRTPCAWCRMTPVCRFETGRSAVRFLDRLKRSEVFERIAAAPTVGIRKAAET